MNWNILKLLFYGSVGANSVAFIIICCQHAFWEDDGVMCRKKPGSSFLKMFVDVF